jgi:methionyl aminopeptidase
MIKNSKEIRIIEENSLILGEILDHLYEAIKPGINQLELEKTARQLIKANDAEPAFLNYGQKYPFPGAACISVNKEVVHSPAKNKVIQKGDLISIDLGLKKNSYYVDACFTKYLGDEPKLNNLVLTTYMALKLAIEKTIPGNHVGDIGNVIESKAKSQDMNVVKRLTGHGIGKKLHEDPQIYNYGRPGEGLEIRPGMVLAIEPIISIGKGKISDGRGEDDPWTIYSADDEFTAHAEHTIVVTEKGNKVLTKQKNYDKVINDN